VIIAPQRAFLLDYKINNPSDTSTHYVRAVIRNSLSGAILATLNLTDNGNGYFSKEWITPSDPSGTGLQLSVLMTVYDDSGYTTESLVYGTELENYIVKDLAGSRSSFGGSGAMGASAQQAREIDYARIKKIIEETVKNIQFPEIKIPEIPQIDVDDLKGDIKDYLDESKEEENITSLIKEELSKAKTEILSELNKKVNEILKSSEIGAVKDLPEKFQMAETSDAELHNFVESNTTKISEEVEGLKKYVDDNFKQLSEKIEKIFTKPIQLELKPTEIKRDLSEDKEEAKEEEQAPEFDQRAVVLKKLLGHF